MKLLYYKELDGVRALAALMVMFFHFFQGIVTNNSILLLIKKYAIFGQTGVSLFFVLSGFLITRILISTKETPRFFHNFYLRRALRIFPLYYLFLIIFYFVSPNIEHVPITSFSEQAYYWVYLQNFAITFNWPSNGPNHFWSLAVEEHFYLFWPILIYFLKPKRLFSVIICIIATAFLVRIVLIWQNIEVFYFTFTRMDELAIGAIVALLEAKKKLISKNSGKFLLLFLVISISTLFIWNSFNATGNKVLQTYKYVLLAFNYFAFIAYIVTINDQFYLKKFFRIKPLIYTGKISYGLYVYHPLCFTLFNAVFGENNLLLSLIGCFVSTFIIASLSYYFFETKFLNLKKYFVY